MSTPILALPEYFALKSKSNGKYLRYVHDDDQARGVLEFSSDAMVSPYVKFYADAVTHRQAEGGYTTMYHLRCCYNNKYWRRASQIGSSISVGADVPEENISKWSCTLFKVEFDREGIVRLLHVQQGRYLGIDRSEPPGQRPECVVAGSSGPEHAEVCEVVDMESVVVLPKRVVFKVKGEGKYLIATKLLRHNPVLGSSVVKRLFFGGDDIGAPSAAHEVDTNPVDATVRIKSVSEGTLWWQERRDENWLRYDSNYWNQDSLFKVVKVDADNNIALRSLSSGSICRQHKFGRSSYCLKADGDHIDSSSILTVEEPVLRRRIYDADFRVHDARIYGQGMPKVNFQYHPNRGSRDIEVTVKVGKTETTNTSWTNTTTWKTGSKVEVSFELKDIPLVEGGKIEFSNEYTSTSTKGGFETFTNSMETSEKITVPPNKQLTITTTKETAACEIPFSYRYTDTLHDGKPPVTHIVEDGLFTSTITVTTISADEEPLPV